MPVAFVRKLVGRQSVVLWAVLAMGIIVVNFITDTTQTALRSPPIAARDPDYYMDHFKLTVTDPLGAPRQWLDAERMLHYADQTAELTAPLLRVAQSNSGEWRVRAQRGRIENDQDINLTGNVTIEYHSSATDPGMRLETDQLRVNMLANTGATDSPVTMVQRNVHVSAVGLRFDLNQQKMQLLSQVRGRYAAE